MRTCISLIALIVSTLCAAAAPGAQRVWEQGPLRWAEFQGEPALEGAPANLGADIALTTTGNPAGSQYALEAEAVMHPDRSWASPEERTEQKLRYFQARYDLLEVLTRRLRAELAGGISGIEADRRLAHYRDLYKEEGARLDRETRYGADERALQLAEYDLRRYLEDIETTEAAQLVPSPWSYGLMAGVGGVFPTGSISDAFGGGCSFLFGILGGWKRVHLHGSIAYSISSIHDRELVNPDYADLSYMANVKNANYLGIGFGLGYALLDGKRFSLEPYVGGQWTGYNWTARPMTHLPDGTLSASGLQQRMQVDDFNVTFGINMEWHFHSVVTSFPIFGSMREQYVSSLRLTPYATRAVYTDATRALRGWQIGFTVAYSGVARALGFK